MGFDKKVKRVDKKNWNEVKSEWLYYIPTLYPGVAPSLQISELLNLRSELDKVSNDGEHKAQVKGLRESIFHEGIFLYHKANSVAKTAYSSYQNGSFTWSLSISYQASFFAAKSLLCFLGISLPKYVNNYFIVDSFPYPEKQSAKEKKLGLKADILIKMIKLKNFQHYHVWKILQRVLDTGTFELIDKKIIHTITSLSEKEFAKQRNELHYQNNYWRLNDMFNNITIDNFAIEKSFDSGNTFHPDKRDDFSIILMFLLLKLNYLVLTDLKTLTNSFNEDYSLMIKALNAIPQYLEFNFETID